MTTSTQHSMQQLLRELPQQGVLEWISLRPSRSAQLLTPETATVDAAQGIVGDRYSGRSGDRQITIIQCEHLAVIGAVMGQAPVAPSILRRNLAVSGINLLALKHRRFQIGVVLLEHTGACHPCSKMERALGAGGYNAMRGHGGITARVITGGEIRIGDTVVALADATPDTSGEALPSSGPQ